MTTGPEHYDEAQRWLRKAENAGSRDRTETVESCAAIAQVHATLAHTAATVDLFALYGQVGDESKAAWRKALS